MTTKIKRANSNSTLIQGICKQILICREKDEVTKVETEVSMEYLRRHFKEGKFAPQGPASKALGK